MFCPNCGTNNEGDGFYCIKCGASLNKSLQAQQEPRGMVNYVCPKCNSNNIQSYEMAYSLGTSKGTSVGHTVGSVLGPGISANSIYARTIQKTSTSSNLALTVSPPQKKRISWWPVSLLIVSVLAFFIMVLTFSRDTARVFAHIGRIPIYIAILSLIMIIKSAINAKSYNTNQLPNLYDEWKHSFICLNCGNRFLM